MIEQTERLLAGRRILTVDDELPIRRLVSRLLTAYGGQVDEADSLQAAVEKCARPGAYDLILLDLYLLDGDGLALLEQIRQTDQRATIVMLTGVADLMSAVTAIQVGADGYIEKQMLTRSGERSDFVYALMRAIEHRAGLIAQQQLQALKEDFYAMVTHDLRNPTGGILSAVELLMHEQYSCSVEEQREVLQIIWQQGQRLLGLINDYLDYAAIEEGYLRLQLEAVDLRQVVQQSIYLLSTQRKARRQVLSLSLPAEPVCALADGQRMQQVIDNLLGNAIKYTPEGRQISVQLYCEAGQAVLVISDTGCGIPPSQLPALFTKYHRLPGNATRGINGSGLGLLIVKEIVTAHGGTIHAQSAGIEGRGSTFTVRIPLQVADSPYVAIERMGGERLLST